MKTLVEDLLKNLNEREREVIKRRFGLENRESETLESIAKDFGITRERVRQIQNNALNKLIKIINENEKITNFVENTKSFLEPLGFREENRF
jgi:RNA polymerase primary sigma factor